MSRDQVVRMLGPTNAQYERTQRRLVFSAGWVNDGIGIGDAQELTVGFHAGRVADARVAYPPDEY